MEKELHELTPMQRKIYLYLKSYIEEHEYAPSVRDICAAVELTATSTVHGHLTRLAAKGFIERGNGKSRAIRIKDGASKARAKSLAVPLICNTSADSAMFEEDNIIEHLPLPKSLLPNETSFALRIKDDNMIGADIFKGDVIIVQEQNYAFNGDIVVAVVNNKTVVGTYHREDKVICIKPENDKNKSIIIAYEEIKVLGKVNGLIRRIK